MFRNVIIIACLYMANGWQIAAQSLIATGGGYYETTNLSVSWSMGEPITESFFNNGIILTQGFQQSKLEPVSIPPDKIFSETEVQVFPIPTPAKVMVRIIKESASLEGEALLTLFDMLGNRLFTETLAGSEKELDLSGLPGSTYFLRITLGEHNYTIPIQKFKY